MSAGPTTILEADLDRPDHQEATLCLLDAYSCDPMGDSHPLSETARRDLIPGLRAHPTTLVFLAYRDAEPVGIAICFRGFSTFAARPLVNIHDFFVRPEVRGQGVASALLETIAEHARRLNCCKLTLEVLEHNHPARRVYAAAGFAQGEYLPEAGGSLFFWKVL